MQLACSFWWNEWEQLKGTTKDTSYITETHTDNNFYYLLPSWDPFTSSFSTRIYLFDIMEFDCVLFFSFKYPRYRTLWNVFYIRFVLIGLSFLKVLSKNFMLNDKYRNICKYACGCELYELNIFAQFCYIM